MPDQNSDLAGKVAFVTGAASGIGRITAVAFAQRGASVAVADIDQQRNHETARMITDLGGQAIAVRCDVTRGDDVQAALRPHRRGVRTPGLRLQQRRRRATTQADRRDHRGGMGPDHHHQPPQRLPLPEVRDPAAAPTRWRRDRQHLLRRRGQGLRPRRRLRRRQTRRHRADQRRRPRLRRIEHPDQRHLPRHHRHRDDGPLHRRYRRRPRQSHRPRTHRTHGPTRRDRRRRRLAVLRRRLLRHRTRPRRRRWPNAVETRGRESTAPGHDRTRRSHYSPPRDQRPTDQGETHGEAHPG